MLKILAPTDFSKASKAGLRFVMQWSSVQKIDILFVHFFHTFRLPVWTDADFRRSIEKEKTHYNKKLTRFIGNLYKKTNIKPGKYSCMAKFGLSADIAIMDYCRDHPGIDYICMATRGAGLTNKLFGTHTGNLTTRSQVPVITIPEKYRIHSISTILYATDFLNYENEIKKVLSFARPLGAKIKVLHLNDSSRDLPDEKTLKAVKETAPFEVDFLIETRPPTQSIIQTLREKISSLRPSLIILFTDQHRNFIKKLISPSKAETLAFKTTIPLLSFNK